VNKTFLGTALLSLFAVVSSAGTPNTAPSSQDSGAKIDLTVPRGGWRASPAENAFVQEVNYPASRVNLRAGTSVSAQISGQIHQIAKGKTPPTLVVNGVFMPLETDETGGYGRPYAFAQGSNSVSVQTGGVQKRVQFYDAASGGARARLRVVLSWDSAGTDLDLHVITPSGQHCFYGNRIIPGGGALDVDVTTGYGPEIFGSARPERGIYHVYVNYYGGGDSTQTITTAQVAVVTDEGTLKETQHLYRVPLRATGDLKYVATFSVL